jgi:hypothetical protein
MHVSLFERAYRPIALLSDAARLHQQLFAALVPNVEVEGNRNRTPPLSFKAVTLH